MVKSTVRFEAHFYTIHTPSSEAQVISKTLPRGPKVQGPDARHQSRGG
jgi:hypothetical protein